MSKLSDAITRANDGRHSARGIARLAQERGYSLNHDTAARYLRGDHGTPDEVTLLALSEVLEIPLRTLRAAANLPSEITTAYVPPAEASRLTRRQRRAVDEIIRSMIDPAGRSRTSVTELPVDRKGKTQRSTQAARAARHGEPEPPTG